MKENINITPTLDVQEGTIMFTSYNNMYYIYENGTWELYSKWKRVKKALTNL